MANWWDSAYASIASWGVGGGQENKDRGAYKDAFEMRMAEKGKDYEMTQALMGHATGQEKELMQASADLDRRNTLDLMSAEHGMKTQGMQESHRLGKDYLAAEGFQQRESMAEQGFQSREGTKTEGEQTRLNVEKQGDVQRRNLEHDREHAAGLATRMARR